MLFHIIQFIDSTIIWYFLALNGCYIIYFFLATLSILYYKWEMSYGNIKDIILSTPMPPVTILMPVFNKEDSICDSMLSALSSNYSNIQLIVINDGSTDKTLKKICEKYNLYEKPLAIFKQLPSSNIKKHYGSLLYPNLIVIDKKHSGKADCLNLAVNLSHSPLVVSVDGDTILEEDTIKLLVYDMLRYPHTIAQTGSVAILNGCKIDKAKIIEEKMAYLPIIDLQICDYLRAFSIGRAGFRLFGGPLIFSGTLSLFEKEALLSIGGFCPNSLAEDMEVILHLHKYMRKNKFPYRMGFSPAATAWSKAPDNMNDLWEQRDRWHRGLCDSLTQYIGMLFNPKYGLVGLTSFPFQLFGECLSPVVEIIGYIAVIIGIIYFRVDWRFAILFFLVSWGFASIITLGTALVSFVTFNKYKRIRDAIYLLLLSTIEQFGFRQLLVACRFIATFRYIFFRISGLIKK